MNAADERVSFLTPEDSQGLHDHATGVRPLPSLVLRPAGDHAEAMSSLPAHATPPAALRPRPKTSSVLLGLGLVATVVALAAAGVVVALGALGSEHEPAEKAFPAQPGKNYGPFGVADDVPTSFGAMSVKHAERIDGLTARDLAGMTHGVNGLVREKTSRVQATVTVTNLLDREVGYKPEHFMLRAAGSGKALPLVGASVKPGKLQPDASLDFRIDFNAPRKAKTFRIEYRDPGRFEPLTVDLGRVKAVRDGRPASAGAQEALRSTASGNHDSGHGE
jgi:hypothetical protein